MDALQLRAELERCHRDSYGWALCCCSRDPSQAEEVLQRVYLKVLEGKARYCGRGAFKTWLFAVIRMTAADERRRELFRRVRLIRNQDRARSSTALERPEEMLDRAHLEATFLYALDALPFRQRQVLQLVFYHDLSLSEAAGVMGISVGSTRTHYDRAKKALRERLKEKAIDETRLRRRTNQGAVL